MGHGECSWILGGSALSAVADLVDAQDRHRLAMSVLAAIVVPPLFLEDDDLVVPLLLQHGRADGCAWHGRRARRRIGALAADQNLAQLDLRAGGADQLLDRL